MDYNDLTIMLAFLITALTIATCGHLKKIGSSIGALFWSLYGLTAFALLAKLLLSQLAMSLGTY